MKISETHKNGAQITVQGWFGVRRTLNEWRARQDDIEPEPKKEPPKNGSSASVSGPVSRAYEGSGRFARTPLVTAQIGFQPND